jgi:hypothetical protein
MRNEAALARVGLLCQRRRRIIIKRRKRSYGFSVTRCFESVDLRKITQHKVQFEVFVKFMLQPFGQADHSSRGALPSVCPCM